MHEGVSAGQKAVLGSLQWQLLSGKAGHPGRGSGGGFRELCGRGGRAAGKVTAKRNGDLP